MLKILPRTLVPAVLREVYPTILCPCWSGPGSLLGRASLSVLPGSLRASVSPTLLISVAFLVQTWSPATLVAPARSGGAERCGPCKRAGSRIRDAPVEDRGGGPGSDPGPSAARKPAESWDGGNLTSKRARERGARGVGGAGADCPAAPTCGPGGGGPREPRRGSRLQQTVWASGRAALSLRGSARARPARTPPPGPQPARGG